MTFFLTIRFRVCFIPSVAYFLFKSVNFSKKLKFIDNLWLCNDKSGYYHKLYLGVLTTTEEQRIGQPPSYINDFPDSGRRQRGIMSIRFLYLCLERFLSNISKVTNWLNHELTKNYFNLFKLGYKDSLKIFSNQNANYIKICFKSELFNLW